VILSDLMGHFSSICSSESPALRRSGEGTEQILISLLMLIME